MSHEGPLARLASLCGILPEYQDLWGRTHACPDETRRVLLRAMRLPADTEGEARSTLEDVETKALRRMLPPAIVSGEVEESLGFRAWIPSALAGGRFRWRLRLEDGSAWSGDFTPSEAQGLEAREAAGTRYLLHRVQLGRSATPGYHRLEVEGPGGLTSTAFIVAPKSCCQPSALQQGRRLWGFAAQLPGVRSRRNWGMGDFSDLRALLEITAASGGDLLGTSPLHALFPSEPERATPYSPSSRCHLNVFHLDVEALPDVVESEELGRMVQAPELQARLRALRGCELVDHRGVAAVKLPLLEAAGRHFREHHRARGTPRGLAFDAFKEERGADLHGLALFQTLQEHFLRQDPSGIDWQRWPAAYQDPASSMTKAFATEHGDRLEFWEYLQWQADLQLAAAAARSRELGLHIGLYGDLAVGSDRNGAEVWLHQELYAVGASIGAPPDDFSLGGQDWGLPPVIPHRLAEAAYAPFVAVLRANMRRAGALRIDHAMGLMRLFWVPEPGPASEGAYVAYPFPELLGILALESQRNRCLVVGEDLGTVPPEVRRGLQERDVLSCRPLYFERDWTLRSFRPPGEYPRQALVSVGTHDLPTLSGFWQGRDLEARNALGCFPSEAERDRQVVERAQDRAQLLVALNHEGLLEPEKGTHPVAYPTMTPELAKAVYVFLARGPSAVLVVQPEDVLGQLEQVNLPGSLPSQNPNWRRKLTLDLEEWEGDGRFRLLGSALCEARRPFLEAGTAGPLRRGAARIPVATYRLQFSRDFTLARATDLVPYLHALGVSHCYASPLLKARPGSAHGYDITDHGNLNPEIGTPEDFDRFVETLRRYGMGLILDFVPNHMAVMGRDNAWWQDVLENGRASPYATFFDIDWRPVNEALHGKVLVPVLGDPYDRVLEGGELILCFEGARGEFCIDYGEHRFPLDPSEYPRILGHGADRLVSRLGEGAPDLLEFESLMAAFRHLPTRDQVSPGAVAERSRDKEIHKRRLAALWERSEDIRLFLGENLEVFNGTRGDPRSFDPLDQLLGCQAFRLAFWRVAADEINYRRFFDINHLAALRMELEPVFEATHRLVLEWIRLGRIDGLRLDHPDGLYDPSAYFLRLQRRAAESLGLEEGSRPLYLVAEKVLSRHERLPEGWAVHGTTGYRFANEVNGLFVNGAAEHRMERVHGQFTGMKGAFEDLLYQCKVRIIRTALASEWNVLANELSRIAQSSRRTREFTLNSLRDALLEVVACFPVYRTYVAPGRLSDQDRHHLEWAVASARKRTPAADISVYDFIREVLTCEIAQGRAQDYADRIHACAMKFQQFTAPVMAKGLEDTCLYRYNRLVSLNDVGGDPRVFGVSPAAFHAANLRRSRTCPYGMLATSTHDSKHSEDFRLRLDMLSEMPATWKLALRRWSRMNLSRKTEVDGEAAPARGDECLLYQTLVGVWPLEPMDSEALAAFRERIERYMLKAVREAKEHTNWVRPNLAYENALARFVGHLLDAPGKNPFLADLQALVERVARPGLLSGLSLALLKLGSPGVPDIYQGCELPVFSLVDPDNRGPVDFGRRSRILARFRALDEEPGTDWAGLARSLLAHPEDGQAKLFVTWRGLNCRRERPGLFQDGEYLPLRAEGPLADHLCAFARRGGGESAAFVAPRRFAALQGQRSGEIGEAWAGNRLEVPAAGEYINAFTHCRIASEPEGGRSWLNLAQVLADFPGALLLGPGWNGSRRART